ncbi:serine/threonine protein kinase [Antrihabitans sp. YC3-6]|uniref:non-specific serine/threonine protein kinase n=1 Tax=Antrihabitans stalagmiti TaxID=2799499 RepID=A0A934NNQ4_9NOCA|nr:serine/threonine-protein kinase [Antrihabitans stalagmiti]MBJ8338515.1 serine/threonine protein kinase [Antrihabitans stalagmiti]
MTQRSGPGIGPDYLVAGRYRLRAKIGGGGMGAVWLAHDKLLDREVAVKQVATTIGLDADTAEALRSSTIHEGRIAAQLSHLHAIAMYDVAVHSGEPWLVMEHLPSRSLAHALTLANTLPPFEVAQIGAQVADALAEAHAAGIIHRDIKPGNILVADRGRALGMVKISDFGISRAKGESRSEADVITGTPAFLAPEVARGDDHSEASDVFSLGATLYTATEGQPPFGFNTDSVRFLEKIARAQITPPQRSEQITDTLLRMLEPNPANRPGMAEVRDELAATIIGPGGNVAYLLGVPVRSAEGTVPMWAHRTTTYTESRTSRAHRIKSEDSAARQQNSPITHAEPVVPWKAEPAAAQRSSGPRSTATPQTARLGTTTRTRTTSTAKPLVVAALLLIAVLAAIALIVVLLTT